MHRSRLAIALIDHPEEAYDDGLAFWSAATGRAPEQSQPEAPYHSLGSFADGFRIEVQRTGSGTPPRIHFDIETDDVEAEVRRLEGLGAKRLRDCGKFWQLTDPAGLVFCVVPPQTAEFDRYAVTWD